MKEFPLVEEISPFPQLIKLKPLWALLHYWQKRGRRRKRRRAGVLCFNSSLFHTVFEPSAPLPSDGQQLLILHPPPLHLPGPSLLGTNEATNTPTQRRRARRHRRRLTTETHIPTNRNTRRAQRRNCTPVSDSLECIKKNNKFFGIMKEFTVSFASTCIKTDRHQER